MYLTWIVWLLNVVVLSIMLFNLLIAIIGQSYEQVLGNVEAHIYKQRAEMTVEAQQILSWLGVYSKSDFTNSIIIRKKKFSDDIAARLNKDKWSGVSKSIKQYLDFCVIAKMKEMESQQEWNKKVSDAQALKLNERLNMVQHTLNRLVRMQQSEEQEPVIWEEADEAEGKI